VKPFWLNGLAVGLVVLAGGMCLAMPFWGDQALFTLYARQLIHGAVLYRDVFDVKQPGIFAFFAFGGLSFGFTEVGIHLFELAYWLAFSVFALVALRPYFTTRWGPALVPVCTVVVYYLYAESVDLTQIEMLVAFPILVAWWLIDRAQPGSRQGIRSYAAAGLAAAAVVLLKHIYLLIILAVLGYTVLRSRRRGVAIRDIRGSLGAFLIALLVPLAVVLAYFAAYGQLGRIWWAYFEVAPAAQLVGTKTLLHLKLGARRFMIGHAPILILAVLGCVHGLRQKAGPRLDLAAGMVLWGAVAAVVFFIQNWGLYKWLLFTVPVGILAVTGAEALVALAGSGKKPRRVVIAAGTLLGVLSFMLGAPVPEVQTRLLWSVVIGVGAGLGAELLAIRPRVRWGALYVVSAALAVSVGLAAIVPAHKLGVLMEHDFAFTADARASFQRASNDSYRAADQDLEVLRRGEVVPGPLYVFGDPVLLLRANRTQPVPIPGWVPEFLNSSAWQELYSDLRSTLPRYIIVDSYTESVIRSDQPAIMGLIASKYKVAFVGASGTWYMLR